MICKKIHQTDPWVIVWQTHANAGILNVYNIYSMEYESF